jgi:hypothetical protein
MPIINDHKLIFIHIPKTAGTSIEHVLNFNGDINGDKKNWYGNIDDYELDHSTIDYLIKNCKYYNNTYLKFCVVRNPYERLVSEYHYCKNYDSRFIKKTDNFKEFIYYLRDNFDFVLSNEEKNHFLISHYLPQYKFTHINNKCEMDMILRFENLEEDWNKLCKKINKNIQLIKVDTYSSKKKYNYLDYYDIELKNIVYELYKDDFIIFNYKK